MTARRQTPKLVAKPVVDPRVREVHRRLLRRRRPWLILTLGCSVAAIAPVFIFMATDPRSVPGAPLLGLVGIVGFLVAMRVFRPSLDRVKRAMGARPIEQECPECGYGSVSPDDGICPECGATGVGRGDADAGGSGV